MVEVPRKTDVFIAGGGPAGLAAAIALRQQGFRVVLADAATPPIDQACGEGLMPGAITALDRLGVTLPAGRFHSFRGIRFLDGANSVEANFPHGEGFGVRRLQLHDALRRRAEDTGVALLWGTPVRGLSGSNVILEGGTIAARWIVGADGGKSAVADWAGLQRARTLLLRYAFRRHYSIRPWSDYVEIYWGPGCQAYVTPVGGNEVCVSAMSRDPRIRLDQVLHRFPALRERLADADPLTSERGRISATRSRTRLYRGRVVLTGDASGSVDAITGEGLRLGFEQAEVLAHALAHENLPAYASAHRRMRRRPALMAALMLSIDRSPLLLRRAMRACAAEPGIFASHLAMHVGECTTMGFIRDAVVPLWLRILTP